METSGGFVPPGWLAAQAPDYTLYGDGTFVVRPVGGPGPQDPEDGFPPFFWGRLDEDAVQRLLGFALRQGRLADAHEHYEQNTCADCPSTTFTVNAGGISKSVLVDGLGVTEGRGADAADRAGFEQLAELLRSFEQRARDGELGEVVAYDPSSYRLTLMEMHGQPMDEARPWPWLEISPADFESVDEWGFKQLVVSRDELALLTEVPSGGHPGLTVEHEGVLWQLGVRPMLPEELAEDSSR